MADFNKGGTARTPFGKNQYLRSVKDKKTESATFAMVGIPTETIDGDATQKVLQPGTLLAKITTVAGASTAADVGKVGVFDTTATDGRQTAANVVGICDTFLPWQLIERDCEVAYVYEATVVQANCFQYTAGVRAALTNATRDAVIAAVTQGLKINYR